MFTTRPEMVERWSSVERRMGENNRGERRKRRMSLANRVCDDALLIPGLLCQDWIIFFELGVRWLRRIGAGIGGISASSHDK